MFTLNHLHYDHKLENLIFGLCVFCTNGDELYLPLPTVDYNFITN